MFAFMRRVAFGCVAALALVALTRPVLAQTTQVSGEEIVQLWPGAAPGSEDWKGPEASREITVPDGGQITVKVNVTIPTLTVFRPAPGKANGTAMLVLPGGAFGALAWDLEGTEVAHWLADRGVTAFLLKYRVRSAPPGQPMPGSRAELLALLEPGRRIAVADATQSVRLLRSNAAKYGINPDRIGMIGFSAGAIATMGTILTAEPAARPNFAAPIYGMTMMEAKEAPAEAPPLFIVSAQDDTTVPAEGSAQIFDLWTKAQRPAELHVYAKGGHGYGMRKRNLPIDHWPTAFEAWLRWQGMLSDN